MKRLRLAGVLVLLIVAGACVQDEAGSGVGSILRVDPALDDIVPTNARIEKLADGFVFI